MKESQLKISIKKQQNLLLDTFTVNKKAITLTYKNTVLAVCVLSDYSRGISESEIDILETHPQVRGLGMSSYLVDKIFKKYPNLQMLHGFSTESAFMYYSK